jgi:hypothetical protein
MPSGGIFIASATGVAIIGLCWWSRECRRIADGVAWGDVVELPEGVKWAATRELRGEESCVGQRPKERDIAHRIQGSSR